MHRPIIKNVCLAPTWKPGGHRCGTLFCSLTDFVRRVGSPHVSNFSEEGIDGAGKVHAEWTFATPRGPASVYDYWWNHEGQLSIGAQDHRAALWCRAWLRLHGFKCSPSNGK